MSDTKRHADAIYAALSPRAPVYVAAPALMAARVSAVPSASEILRRQIAAARETRMPGWSLRA